ncbi:MAG: RNA polymerase sigma factor [Patescibacteria group bacterium]
MADLKETFSQIYDQLIGKIYRFVFLKVNSEATAQDITSEAFTRCWECFKNGDTIDNPSAFLYQIARNLVTDYYREKGKNQIVSVENTTIADPSDDFSEAMLKSDINTVKLVLAGLKDDYQNVIIWHYLDDFSIQEVAKMMDRTEDNTRVLLHRALESLRKKCNKQA